MWHFWLIIEKISVVIPQTGYYLLSMQKGFFTGSVEMSRLMVWNVSVGLTWRHRTSANVSAGLTFWTFFPARQKPCECCTYILVDFWERAEQKCWFCKSYSYIKDSGRINVRVTFTFYVFYNLPVQIPWQQLNWRPPFQDRATHSWGCFKITKNASHILYRPFFSHFFLQGCATPPI